MNHLPKLTFITVGPEAAPSVQTISTFAWGHYLQAVDLGNRRGSPKFRLAALAEVFGRGVTAIIPAWEDECLNGIVADYAGPHADAVKQLAAVILLRESFERPVAGGERKPEPKGRSVSRGGKRVRLDVPPAAPPGTLGALFDEEEARLLGAA